MNADRITPTGILREDSTAELTAVTDVYLSPLPLQKRRNPSVHLSQEMPPSMRSDFLSHWPRSRKVRVHVGTQLLKSFQALFKSSFLLWVIPQANFSKPKTPGQFCSYTSHTLFLELCLHWGSCLQVAGSRHVPQLCWRALGRDLDQVRWPATQHNCPQRIHCGPFVPSVRSGSSENTIFFVVLSVGGGGPDIPFKKKKCCNIPNFCFISCQLSASYLQLIYKTFQIIYHHL